MGYLRPCAETKSLLWEEKYTESSSTTASKFCSSYPNPAQKGYSVRHAVLNFLQKELTKLDKWDKLEKKSIIFILKDQNYYGYRSVDWKTLQLQDINKKNRIETLFYYLSISFTFPYERHLPIAQGTGSPALSCTVCPYSPSTEPSSCWTTVCFLPAQHQSNSYREKGRYRRNCCRERKKLLILVQMCTLNI